MKKNLQEFIDAEGFYLLGEWWTIEVRPLPNLNGHVSYDHRSIHIHDELDEEASQKTLLHEIIHAIIMLTGIHDILDDLPGDFPEGITVALENGLWSLLSES